MNPIPASFYDAEYFTKGTKSNYAPYAPGGWAEWLADMVVSYLAPESVLDVGCAYGFVVGRLREVGIAATGFDISDYAISRADLRVRPHIWIGDASDRSSYDEEVDLVLATELPEHLTEEQSESFLRNARSVAQRALLLTAMYPDGQEPDPSFIETDHSHINVKPVSWWLELARRCGWEIDDARAFNEDVRAREMQWAGRFLLLRRPQ